MVNKAHDMKKILQAEYLFIFLLIAVNIAIGIATVSDYGESWDEARLYEYGDQSLNAYRALFNPAIPVDFGNDDLRYYGPVYFMGMSLLVKLAHDIHPQLPIINLWHFGNFLCLQLGVLAFYHLLRRFVSVVTALATAALFASQPLIWGHGFINPKDIPFMTLFTASVYFGLRLVEHFEKHNFEIRSLLRNPWFYAAAVTLGLTISIRILGFAAAVIVLFYFASVNAKKVLRLSYPYFGVALFVSFLTWPYLWPSPIVNFLKGIYAMLKFQWIGHTLFNGVYYSSNQLPRQYVPQLLAMQLTEPTLFLLCIGITAFFLSQQRKTYKGILILFLIWFGMPLLYILINGMNLYDNTRQLLFIFPALFLIVGIGFDMLLRCIQPRWAQMLILVFMMIPGIIGIVKFHPYEYSFYNTMTTSSQKIFRNFETDYWATSFKQVSRYINDNAPEDSLVIVWGPSQLIQHYARNDIQVKSFDDLKNREYTAHPYYLVLTTRYDMDQKFFPDVQPVYSVQQNDCVLAVVKYITPHQ